MAVGSLARRAAARVLRLVARSSSPAGRGPARAAVRRLAAWAWWRSSCWRPASRGISPTASMALRNEPKWCSTVRGIWPVAVVEAGDPPVLTESPGACRIPVGHGRHVAVATDPFGKGVEHCLRAGQARGLSRQSRARVHPCRFDCLIEGREAVADDPCCWPMPPRSDRHARCGRGGGPALDPSRASSVARRIAPPSCGRPARSHRVSRRAAAAVVLMWGA